MVTTSTRLGESLQQLASGRRRRIGVPRGRDARNDLAAARDRRDAGRLVDARPRKFSPTWLASAACIPMRIGGAKPAFWRCSASRRWIATAAATACSGESKPTKKPSPVVEISLPWCAVNTSRSVVSCQRSSVSHASSPSDLDEVRRADDVGEHERLEHAPRSARPCRAAATAGAPRPPRSRSPPVGQANAASRSSSSSTLSGSTTSALPKSPASQSKAVGAIVMQLPAPMHLWRSTRTRAASAGRSGNARAVALRRPSGRRDEARSRAQPAEGERRRFRPARGARAAYTR